MTKKLPYVVECKSMYPFFETIAAFNVDIAASSYARECKLANPSFEYRVMKNGKPLSLALKARVAVKGRSAFDGSWLRQGTRQSRAVK
jgi:hypothetical protein